eukprot:CAMPEP_0172817666 /NCGR_PEP_ID=MMETSP1075-20121228/13376_1 /TAXON_ID=2916 /ORGANISM="Ceratium fusus, Strain PA161109" /LENGTH=58 /DNA_ID=CAMNT_0013657917 /DNA_START=225 /DNA_END=398 /DNA_ORIENTATION=-
MTIAGRMDNILQHRFSTKKSDVNQDIHVKRSAHKKPESAEMEVHSGAATQQAAAAAAA